MALRIYSLSGHFLIRMKIGMLTIGQSPRSDILPGLSEILGTKFEIVEAGALDDLTKKDLESIEIQKDDYLLVSRMRDGTEIKITKRIILPLLQKKIKMFEEKGIRIMIIMCTGKFPKFESTSLIVTPQDIIQGVLNSAIKKGSIGVVYPAKEQTKMAEAAFGREGIKIYADYLSPYEGKNNIDELADRLAKKELDIILLNCFGFNSDVKKIVAQKTCRPVILSNTLVARVLKELVY
jgi:protein AroM